MYEPTHEHGTSKFGRSTCEPPPPELPERLVPVSQQLWRSRSPLTEGMASSARAADGKLTRGLFPDARLEVAVVCAH